MAAWKKILNSGGVVGADLASSPSLNNSLTTNGSGVLSWTGMLPLSGGTLTGALTGTSATFAGDLSLNSANGNLGIHWDSAGSGNAGDLRLVNANSLALWGSSKIVSINQGVNIDGSHASGKYVKLFASSSSVPDMIVNDGKIGIGTQSPASLLHLKGTGDAIRVESTNAGAGGAQMDLLHFTASPADEDVFGQINMGGYYSGTTNVYGTQIKSYWTDVSARYSRLEFYTCETTVNKVLTLDNSKNATFTGNIDMGDDDSGPHRLTIHSIYNAGAPSLHFRTGHPTEGNNNVWTLGKIEVGDDGNYNGTMNFFTSTTGYNGTVNAGMSKALELDSSQNATFAGNVDITGTHCYIGNHGWKSDANNWMYITGSAGTSYDSTYSNIGAYKLYASNALTSAGTLDVTGNATFAGNVDINGTSLYIGPSSGNNAEIYLDGSNGDFSGSDYVWIRQKNDKNFEITMDSAGGTDYDLKQMNTSGQMRFYSGGVLAQTLDSSQNATFAGNITASGNSDLMVGNTAINLASGFANQKGFSVDGSSGRTDAVGSNTEALQLGRYGGHGSIQVWRYASNQVASMGSAGELICGTATFSGNVITNGRTKITTDGQFYWGSAYNQGYLNWTTGKVMMGGIGGNGVDIITNNTTAIGIDTSQNATFAGNVGINGGGTNHPLEVAGGHIQLDVNKSLTWTGNYSHVYGDGANTTGYLMFYTSDTLRMKITGDGKVGIGTESPSSLLDIFKDNDGASSGPDLYLSRQSDTPAGSDVLGSIHFRGRDTIANWETYASIQGVIQEATHTQEEGYLQFLTKDNGADVVAMTIGYGLNGVSNVGIGTTSPDRKLTVYQSTDNVLANFESGDTGAVIYINDNTTNDNVYIQATGTKAIFGGTTLALNTGGSDRLSIDSSGNSTFAGNVTLNSKLTFNYNDYYFEAGTGSVFLKNGSGNTVLGMKVSELDVPSALTVGGNATFAGDVHIKPSALTGFDAHADDYLIIEKTGGVTSFNQAVDVDQTSYLMFSDTTRNMGSIAYFHDGDSMSFRVNANTALTLDSSQNATFAGDVEIDGTSHIGDTYNVSTAIATDDNIHNNNVLLLENQNGTNGSFVGIGFQASTSQQPRGQIAFVRSDHHKGHFAFKLKTSGSASTEVLKLDNNNAATFAGNVTIPATKKLYLDGGGSTYIYESSDGVIDFYGDTVHLASFKQNGTQSEVVINEGSGDVDFRVEANTNAHAFFVEAEGTGKVGIGTASPLSTLHIDSTAYYSQTTALTYSGLGNVTGALINGYKLDGDSLYKRIVDIVSIGDSANNRGSEIRFLTAPVSDGVAVPNMVIASGGNVGIGVTDPDSTLEILDTTTQLKLSYDGSNATTFTVDSSGGYSIDCPHNMNIDSDRNMDFDIGSVANSREYRFKFDNTELITFQGDLNGIGTTSPDFLLDIESSGTPTLCVRNSSASADAKIIIGEPNTSAYGLELKWAGAAGNVYIDNRYNHSVNPHMYFRMKTSGTPLVALTINPDATTLFGYNATFSGNVIIPNGSVSSPSINFSNHSNTGIYMGASTSLRLAQGGVDALVIDSSQNATFAGKVQLTATHATTQGTALHLKSSAGHNWYLHPNGTTGNLELNYNNTVETVFDASGDVTFAGDIIQVRSGVNAKVYLGETATHGCSLQYDYSGNNLELRGHDASSTGQVFMRIGRDQGHMNFYGYEYNFNAGTVAGAGNAYFAGTINSGKLTIGGIDNGDTAIEINLNSNYKASIDYLPSSLAVQNYLRFKLSSGSGTQVTPLILYGDNSATFAGNVSLSNDKYIAVGQINFHNANASGLTEYVKIRAGGSSAVKNGIGLGSGNGDLTIYSDKDDASEGNIIFKTQGTTALTIDSSQNATFAGEVSLSAPSSGHAFLYMTSDNGEDNHDKWYIQASEAGSFAIANYGGGSWNNLIVVDHTTGNTSFDGTINSGAITATGNTKVTTSNTDTTFTIETTSGTTIFPVLDFVSSHASVGAKIRSDGSDIISFDNSLNVTFAGTIDSGAITSTGDVTAFSDRRLKTNINTIDSALDKVTKMRGVTYDRIDGSSSSAGVLADELEKIAPELVHDGEYKSVAYGNLTSYLIEAIKELKSEVEVLRGNA